MFLKSRPELFIKQMWTTTPYILNQTLLLIK